MPPLPAVGGIWSERLRRPMSLHNSLGVTPSLRHPALKPRPVVPTAEPLRRFCEHVARTYRIDDARGYPANLFDLRQYVDVNSETYFFRISKAVAAAASDPALKRCNRDYETQWTRAITIRMVGAEAAAIDRMIETLQLERLLIEYATSCSAFNFQPAGSA